MKTTETLQPGEECDRLISGHVMGVAPRDVRAKGSTDVVRIWSDNSALSDGVWSADDLRLYGAAPNFSTDVRAAWSAVDELAWRVLSVEVAVEWAEYRCTVTVIRDRAPLVGVAKTMPLAVCRAAMLFACEETPSATEGGL